MSNTLHKTGETREKHTPGPKARTAARHLNTGLQTIDADGTSLGLEQHFEIYWYKVLCRSQVFICIIIIVEDVMGVCSSGLFHTDDFQERDAL